MELLEIVREPIELHKALKLHGWMSSGGLAKAVIGEGLVRLNGEVETRKRKKIFVGDVIGFEGETVKVVLER